MGIFTKAVPKKPIITLPEGYSEEKLINELNKVVLFMMAQSQEKKDKLLKSITSAQVLVLSTKYANALLDEFKIKHYNNIEFINEKSWHIVEATFFESIYICTLIFYNDKQIRGEQIQVPTGKQYEEYFINEVKEFDNSSDYADILIPPYIFKLIKDISTLVFTEFSKHEYFDKTSEEFQTALITQYIYLSTVALGAYLIQDSYLKK